MKYLMHDLVLRLSSVVLICVVVTTATYTWVIPSMFPGYRSYSVFLIGVGCAAVLGGYFGYRSDANGELLGRLSLAFICGAVVATVVALLSLLIIVNVRGS
jgi:hypothetical protein